MKRIIVIVGVVLLGGALLTFAYMQPRQFDEPVYVSLIQLIGNPEKYDGKLVSVAGYLRLEFEGNALYLHQEDEAHMLSKNAIWVDASGEMIKSRTDLDKNYVLLVGIFDAKNTGHMGLFSGAIRDVRRAGLGLNRANAGPGALRPNNK